MLFVCTGNICRSPTAERLLAAYGEKSGIRDLTVSSAGTRAVIDHPIHREAAAVLEVLGGNTSHFSARQLTPRIASNADLLLTMTREHRDTVLQLAPRQLNKTFTLSEAAHLAAQGGAQRIADLAALRSHMSSYEVPGIPDPVGQSPEFFASIGAQISRLVLQLLDVCRFQ